MHARAGSNQPLMALFPAIMGNWKRTKAYNLAFHATIQELDAIDCRF